jgi:hypothetical protein
MKDRLYGVVARPFKLLRGAVPPNRLLPVGRVGQLEDFIERHPKPWELTFGFLSVAYVALVIGGDDLGLPVPRWVLYGFSAIFLTEFSLRLWTSRQPLDYLRGHWIDAVTALPLPGDFRAFRVLRLLRLGWLFRLVTGWIGTVTGTSRNGIPFIASIVVVFVAIGTYGFWVIEDTSIGDAAYTTVLSTLTLGLASRSASAGGQIWAGLLVFMALGLSTYVSGRVTNWMLGERGTDAVVREQADVLRSEISELRALIRDLSGADAVESGGEPLVLPLVEDANGLVPQARLAG